MPRPLGKPTKRRPVRPRVCATCRYFERRADGDAVCQRDPDNVQWQTGSQKPWFEVCLNWKE